MYELVRNAKVVARETKDEKNFPVLVAEVDDRLEHRFPATSRVSKALEVMTIEDLQERLDGGHFFFVGDDEGTGAMDLVDFRDCRYNGFVHDDESIAALADFVGIHGAKEEGAIRVRKNLMSSNWVLGSRWSKNEISVPQYKEGGEFHSELHFDWNPFVKTINSAFQLVRLICTNGMVGLTSFLNSKIPLMNRWEEHLNIANQQIQNKVNGMVVNRLGIMGSERATIGELLLLAHHAQARLIDGNVDSVSQDRLRNIFNAVHPVAHVGDVYRTNVLQDKRLAAQLPGHLSTFDAFNVATEISSHTAEVSDSTDHALHRMANELVFNRKDTTSHASRFVLPPQSAFSDPDAAFFGNVH